MTKPTAMHKLVQALATLSASRATDVVRPAHDGDCRRPARLPGAVLLAALLPLLTPAAATAAERPRPENFANYSLYIQALVDYQRAQEAESKAAPKKSGASKLCRDDQGEKSSEKKKSSCEGKYLLVEDMLPEEYERDTQEADLETTTAYGRDSTGGGSDGSSDPYAAGEDGGYGLGGGDSGYGSSAGTSGDAGAGGAGSGIGSLLAPGGESSGYESVEEVIARVGYRQDGGTIDGGSPEQRPMFNGIPLTEIPVQDLSEAGIEGLLGLFDNARVRGVTGTSGSGFVPGLGPSYGVGSSGIVRGITDGLDGSLLAWLDVNYQVTFYQPGILNLTGFSWMANGYSIVNADVSMGASGSVNLGLSSETHMQLWVVDRDGMPWSDHYYAGALELSELGVLVPRLEVNIQGVRSSSGDGLMQVDAYSPQPIFVDLRGTRIGAADAVRDGSQIGTATPFLVFGPNSILTVAAGTNLRTHIGEPSGMTTPFVTLNGYVGDISVEDIRLVDNNSGGSIRIGRFGVQGLNLVDTKLFLDDTKVVLDIGRGITNLGFDIERLSLGNDVSDTIVGDFYARGGRINSLRMTAEPH